MAKAKTPAAPTEEKINNIPGFGEKKRYEEWEVKLGRKDGILAADKIKKIRDVSITEDNAAILNDGVMNGGNSFAVMYFAAE